MTLPLTVLQLPDDSTTKGPVALLGDGHHVRIRLGSAVEGRDEKGIKKIVSAFLKLLHPGKPPSDDEFIEYVAYAVECRRRVKEQMNKRKPDDEFARIGLSYIDSEGNEVVVECPESRGAAATQSPVRRSVNDAPGRGARSADVAPSPAAVLAEAATNGDQEALPEEQHFTIMYGDTGHSYESIIGPYLRGAKAIEIEDPYVRMSHQIQNFVRFCEAVLKLSHVKKIRLVTNSGDSDNWTEMADRLEELKQSLLERDVVLDIEVNPNLHDREIRIDNGWTIKIGRGLDIYQKPDGWFSVGANDLSLRHCLETKVDIYREASPA